MPVILLFLVKYANEQYIVNVTQPKEYKISDINCYKHFRDSSKNRKPDVWIEYNGSKYHVKGLMSFDCYKNKKGSLINLYYDNLFDVFFMSPITNLYIFFGFGLAFMFTYFIKYPLSNTFSRKNIWLEIIKNRQN